jgi:protein phosphatase methylesterase 1
MLLLHGGGHSALSWAVFTKEITKMCDVHVLAFDFRGHGGTSTDNDEGASVLVSVECHCVQT